ncbi:tRNA (adenosine(37)-N6)-threonylcarbamoyltransferase complex dimerization subunit type 1 TsaB [Chondromyces apiculatus]|uniref:Metal-dependent protease, putative molecular chaperone n=1 Tax=Chondromyces apiculatus DSM 436 TaxID=1192034 RepID=A0A017T1D0_9BACT|nr:tRNA (adenosine(37)-N6)-threonylcarbamoyltransferase complex dimerization subunit type 1 TsaB [Chondromyces apiculatus]EYF02376.1 metal-dependent protease, putative molecular chaperone [Chondromyces apiculatus DSM 436]
MKILALSTSTPRGSVALLDVEHSDHGKHGERVLASMSYDDLHGHAERIISAIEETLAAAGATRADIQALACDIGPGSFTGVRVAVATVKGIALALATPAVGVISLEAMAAAAFASAAAPGDLVVPVIDAKKGELFLAVYDAPHAPPRVAPRHLARDEVPAALAALAEGARVVVVGVVAEELPALRPHLAQGPGLGLPDASWIGRLAAERLARGPSSREDLDAAAIEPLYVRAPDAKPAQPGYAPPR